MADREHQGLIQPWHWPSSTPQITSGYCRKRCKEKSERKGEMSMSAMSMSVMSVSVSFKFRKRGNDEIVGINKVIGEER